MALIETLNHGDKGFIDLFLLNIFMMAQLIAFNFFV